MTSYDKKFPRWHYILLWLLVFGLIISNIALIATLLNARDRVFQETEAVARMLDDVQLDQLDLVVDIDESVPIELTVPVSDTFVVPISTTVSVSD